MDEVQKMRARMIGIAKNVIDGPERSGQGTEGNLDLGGDGRGNERCLEQDEFDGEDGYACHRSLEMVRRLHIGAP